MALNTEIDALLAKATAEGVAFADLLVRLSQRNSDTAYPDEYPATSFSLTVSDFAVMKAWLGDTTTEMPMEICWNRLWSGIAMYDSSALVSNALQLVRIVGRENQFSTAYPKISTLKSAVLTGKAYFNF